MNRTPKKFYAQLWEHGEPTSIHAFTLEPAGKNDYRAAISCSYFREREEQLSCSSSKLVCHKFRTYVLNAREFEDLLFSDERVGRITQESLPVLPVFEYDSIWEFYVAIGYDHLNKKYLEDTDMTPKAKRLAEQEAKKLRIERTSMEQRLAKFGASPNGSIYTTAKARIAEIERRLTALNVK